MSFDRRTLLLASVATLAAPAIVRAQANRINVFAHRVHRTVATGAQGGDITAPFTQRTGVGVEWVTFDTGPLQERLFREASLAETTVDVGFVLNTQATPRIAALFEPLGPYLEREGIEEPADVFSGAMTAFQVGGAQVAMPFRHASSGMHYNQQFFEERGVSGPPRTIEDLAETARKCTWTRDGQPVVGLVLPGVTYPNVIDIARAWDGEFITPDLRVACAEPPMVRALTLLRELFQAGAFPRNFASINTEDVNVWMQNGRAAMVINSMGRNQIYNDPARSNFPGKFQTTTIPISRELAGRYPVAPAKVEFWGMAIPRSSRNKERAWAFIRSMLTKEATLGAALNGNGPVRASTYDDPRLREKVPYADAERDVLRVARVPMPAFDNAQRAADLFKEEAEAVVLGRKQAQAAMDDLARRVRPLVTSG